VSKQVAVVAAPAVQTAAIFCEVPTKIPEAGESVD
jgi:hypothetical protein